MKLEELCAAVQEAPYYSKRFTRREYRDAFREYGVEMTYEHLNVHIVENRS